MLTRIGYVFLFLSLVGYQTIGQSRYRDWNRRVCPILDTPHQAFEGYHFAHHVGTDTGTAGWGDRVSVTDLEFWGQLPSWETDTGFELELRGHLDFRFLEGLQAGSGIDRQHGFMMLRGVAVIHQRFLGGFGLQARIQPGIYAALSKPSGNIFYAPLGGNLVQALTPHWGLFAGLDYYPGFEVGVDPRAGVVYSRYDLLMQLAYPETRFSVRPYGGRLQLGLGAEFTRWLEYRLGRDDDRDSLRFRENQVYSEVSWDTRRLTQFALQVGYTFRRRAVFTSGDTVALEDTPFVAVGIRALY